MDDGSNCTGRKLSLIGPLKTAFHTGSIFHASVLLYAQSLVSRNLDSLVNPPRLIEEEDAH